MKLSDVSLDVKSLALGAVVGGVLMLSVGAATTTGSPSVAKWDYKVASIPHDKTPEAFLNEVGKEGWVLVSQNEGRVFYFRRGIK
jgi:hypothetical protein